MPKETREVWAKRVERWKDSGLTSEEFAAEIGISAQSLSWWRWRFAKESKESKEPKPAPRNRRRKQAGADTSAASPMTFVEVTAAARSDALEVVLSSGRMVRVRVGFDGHTFERLLGILERPA